MSPTPLEQRSQSCNGQRRRLAPLALMAVTAYELLEELGRGRMGVVYRALHGGLNREVAVKVMRDALFAGRRERERFRSEAEAVASLKHPHIVQVYDYGEHDDVPFFVMEYLEGGNLTRRLKRCRLTLLEAAELIETLARAIHHAHENGIIHRDLKPGNILFDADGTPKIADFSIAKYFNRRGDPTETVAIMGTACYMAPEQAWGHSRSVTPRADIYSLGVILYQALTGQTPFRGESTLETLAQVRDALPLAPSLRQAGIPAELDAICMKCLRKEPGRRYRSALTLAEDLHRYRDRTES
jgi:serine/threonine protein kinase